MLTNANETTLNKQRTKFAWAYQGPALDPRLFQQLEMESLETTMVNDTTYALLTIRPGKNCRGKQVLKAIQAYNKWTEQHKQIHLCKLPGQPDEIICELEGCIIPKTIQQHRWAARMSNPSEDAKHYIVWKRPTRAAEEPAPAAGGAAGVPAPSLEQQLADSKEVAAENVKDNDQEIVSFEQLKDQENANFEQFKDTCNQVIELLQHHVDVQEENVGLKRQLQEANEKITNMQAAFEVCESALKKAKTFA